MVDHLRSQFLAQKTVGIAYLYFRYDDEKSQVLTDLMGSIVQQLAQRRGILDPYIKAMYETHTANRGRPTVDIYRNIIAAQMEKLDKIYIVADALDECPEIRRRDFLLEINRLASKANIFLTSRDNTNVKQYFAGDMEELIIRATDDDVQRYVEGRLTLEKISPLLLGYHLQAESSLEDDILRSVVKKANGMCVLISNTKTQYI